jgi:outer membrane protein OmpA-like peptidoglycan-associated protein
MRFEFGFAVAVSCLAAGLCAPSALAAPARPACRDFSFPIYFARGSDVITPAAKRAIAAESRRWSLCEIDRVKLLGGRDKAGPAARDEDLARRRTLAVEARLQAAGVHNDRLSSKVVPIGKGDQILPRRVTVEVKLISVAPAHR